MTFWSLGWIIEKNWLHNNNYEPHRDVCISGLSIHSHQEGAVRDKDSHVTDYVTDKNRNYDLHNKLITEDKPLNVQLTDKDCKILGMCKEKECFVSD